MKSSFPIIDYSGRILGMVALKRAHETLKDSGQHLTAGEIVIPLEDLMILLPNKSAVMYAQVLYRVIVFTKLPSLFTL